MFKQEGLCEERSPFWFFHHTISKRWSSSPVWSSRGVSRSLRRGGHTAEFQDYLSLLVSIRARKRLPYSTSGAHQTKMRNRKSVHELFTNTCTAPDAPSWPGRDKAVRCKCERMRARKFEYSRPIRGWRLNPSTPPTPSSPPHMLHSCHPEPALAPAHTCR
jgi:hypothetical protein